VFILAKIASLPCSQKSREAEGATRLLKQPCVLNLQTLQLEKQLKAKF
jgi:hypothetical protein